MDWEHARMNANIYGLKAKAKLRLAFQVAGLLAVALGAFNMLAAPVTGYAAFAPYRTGAIVAAGESGGIFFLADVAVMVVGAAVVWWT